MVREFPGGGGSVTESYGVAGPKCSGGPFKALASGHSLGPYVEGVQRGGGVQGKLLQVIILAHRETFYLACPFCMHVVYKITPQFVM